MAWDPSGLHPVDRPSRTGAKIDELLPAPAPNHDIPRQGGRSGRLDGLIELLDAGGQLEVAVGQATLGVTGEGQGDLVPADVDVGVVAGRLSRVGVLVDEQHRMRSPHARRS